VNSEPGAVKKEHRTRQGNSRVKRVTLNTLLVRPYPGLYCSKPVVHPGALLCLPSIPRDGRKTQQSAAMRNSFGAVQSRIRPHQQYVNAHQCSTLPAKDKAAAQVLHRAGVTHHLKRDMIPRAPSCSPHNPSPPVAHTTPHLLYPTSPFPPGSQPESHPLVNADTDPFSPARIVTHTHHLKRGSMPHKKRTLTT
jgi:hypothetical protein